MVEGHSSHCLETDDFMLSSLRIFLGQCDARVFTPRFSDEFPFKIHEVLLGPLNFYADQDKSAVCI